jgi:lipoate-protein ligase A
MVSMRLLKTDYHSAFWNMALDEVMMGEAAKEEAEFPSLRLYRWKPPAVSIGYFQRLDEEVDVEKCRELGIEVVRRATGGGAVFHDAEITYSFITKEYPASILESYQLVCGAILRGLEGIGIKGQFVPLNDLVLNGKKFSGNAQTRRNGVMLQHGTILLEVDVDKMFSLLKVPDEKMRGKLISSVKERVCGLGISYDEASEALVKGFAGVFNAEMMKSTVSATENKRAEELAMKKYASKEWLDRI